ncbi:kinesin-like protein KIF18A [Sorex araneus]|uniref:kinesin-like protein KIF18A n=1 Tax=Sorex araneus TaxID=42254 RepID=UPI002433A2CF|nr:kinesin-like protein KIF18A [Sorex araneus]
MAATEEDLCHHMKVVVRVRPENTKEKAVGFHKVVHVVDKHILVFDPKQEEISFFHGKKIINRDTTKRQNKDLKFVFDAVFDETSTQLEVFENTTKPILRSFLNGYNCTVLAYGATGAGKTHTMLGSAAEPGVMYLTMLDLYKSMDEIKEEKVCSTAVSYLEVYNEQIRDLLVNSGPLAVREDAQKGVVVQGLTLHQPKSSEEILQLLDNGNKNRTQHPTDMNATSSRSHAVFQIYLRQQDKTASINQNIRIAKMSLIDLAGSERASTANTKGTRFIEGTNINRSLLALGNVINALADSKRKNQHIPYRNSKLTRLLKDSLGGNCQTIMIAAVSPSSVFYDDTYNTLKYANRAKDIKSSVKSNVLNLNNHITQYLKICNEQKQEILMLKEKLRVYEEQQAFTDDNKAKLLISSPQQKEIERFQEILNCLFQNREEIRQEYLKLEMLLKENELKSFYQQQCHKQIEMMCSEDKVEKATCKRDHRLAMLKTRRCYLENKREEELKRFDENSSWLCRVENEMALIGQNGHISKELSKDLYCHHLHLQNQDLKAQIKHMIDLAGLQEQQHRQTEAVLNALLPALRKQYSTLKEAGLSNVSFETDFKEIEHLVERKKVVVWADQTTEHTKQNGLPEVSVLMNFPQLRPVEPILCTSSSQSNVLKIPPQKRTRRKLMPSPLKAKHTQTSAVSESMKLNDSLSKELEPIVYTPEDYRKTSQNSSTVPLLKPPSLTTDYQSSSSNISGDSSLKICEVDNPLNRTKGYEQEDLDSTFIVCKDSTFTSKLPEQESLLNNNILQRLAPSFSSKHSLPDSSILPSYMAMTAAAKRKRKLTSSASSTSLTAEVNSGIAKRIRRDASTDKLLQENRPVTEYRRNINKIKPTMVRRFGRNISKENLR